MPTNITIHNARTDDAPLPQFERTLGFYEREGFTVTGGRKLKTAL